MDMEKLLRDNEEDKPVRCTKCGSFLKYIGLGEYICEDCGFKEYDSYGKVRAYLEKNPGSNIVRTEAATGVPQKLIYQMVTEGKLDIRSGSEYLKGGKGE